MLTQNALPDAALVSRFAESFARLSGADCGDRIGVAVSGGPDSLALLLLAAAAFPDRIEAATVDHRLRAASGDEAAFVSEICASHGIRHETLTLDALPGGNVSAKAREARYAALGLWANRRTIDWLLTAHHADDQLETMVMRLNRSAGVAGLSGVRARTGHIIRPLLGWRRSELANIVTDAGITPIDDPSNRDDRYDRARLRKELAQAAWLDPVAASRSASALADVEAATEWSIDALEKIHVMERQGFVSFDRYKHDFPPEYIRRIVLRCLLRIDSACRPREAQLAKIMMTLERKGVATIGNVICRGSEIWIFHAAPLRRTVA